MLDKVLNLTNRNAQRILKLFNSVSVSGAIKCEALKGTKTPVQRIRMSNIKENWLKVDEVCTHCGQVTKRQKGITKQSLKRLITPKFTMDELIITFMIIMVLVLAFAYNAETKSCREWIKPMYAKDLNNCKSVCNVRCELIQWDKGGSSNITNALYELNKP